MSEGGEFKWGPRWFWKPNMSAVEGRLLALFYKLGVDGAVWLRVR